MNQEHVHVERDLFEDHELFVSMTDPRGILLAGNDVFSRASGYPHSKLMGSPHNIIRHPDMPKSVFKLLWDTLKSNQGLSAYVKNRAQSGQHYWVFATALPVPGGFLSVRVKPRTELCRTVESLYAKVREIEKAQGMEAGIEFIQSTVRTLGFADYREFMAEAILQEMDPLFESRDAQTSGTLRSQGSGEWDSILNLIQVACGNSAKRFRSAFLKVKNLRPIRKEFKSHAHTIAKSCEVFAHLSMNMGVTAKKLGNEGHALAVVAHEFQNTASEIKEKVEGFRQSIDGIARGLSESRYSVASLTLQLEMLQFYAEESTRACAGLLSDQASELKARKARILNEFEWLSQGVKMLFERTIQFQRKTIEDFESFLRICNGLHGLVTGLDLIRLGGRLEGAHTEHAQEKIFHFTREVQKFIQDVSTPISEMHSTIEQDLELLESIQRELGQSAIILSQIELLQIRLRSEGIRHREAVAA